MHTESDDFQDDAVDDLLRREFGAAFPSHDASQPALEGMRPTLVRARRRHVAKQVAGATVVGVLLVAGLGLGARTLRPVTDDRVETGPADGTGPTPSDENADVLVVDDTAPPTPGPTATATDDPQSGDEGAPSTGSSTSAASPASTSTATGPTTTTPDAGTTATSTPGTITGPGPTTEVDSPCGSIVVRVVGSGVELVEVRPKGGGEPDIKNRGPGEIEVSFEGSAGHCELKASVRDGQLQTSVDDEGDGQ